MSNRIVYGDRFFTGYDVVAGNCFLGNSMAGDELAIDTLEVTVRSEDTLFFPIADAAGLLLWDSGGYPVLARPRLDDLTQYVYGEPVLYYHDEKLIGKFYLSSVARVGPCSYTLSCISAVGLLDKTNHYGGLYTGQRLADVVADILSNAAPYSIDPRWAELPLYGWLPIATRRENLHQVLFALGLALRKDSSGEPYITALDAGEQMEIDGDRLYAGGSIDYQSPATTAVVSEHAYLTFPGDERKNLYSGEVAAEGLTTPKGATVQGTLVPFDDPMHDLEITGGTILEQGVNYAVLGQASDCLLTGQKYTHVTRELATGFSADKDNAVTVTDATLVSLANSENVAERVFAYYSSTKIIQNDMAMGAERPGDAVRMQDPFGDMTDAIIKSMDINISGLLKASTTFAQGYIPTGIGNYYTHSVVITKDEPWMTPTGCKGKIRFVLISGGAGGLLGGNGEDGGTGSTSSGGKGGKGGIGGVGGSGGRLYVATITVTPGQSFAVKIGAGGRGQTAMTEAAEGGTTTFGTFSSADGRPSDTGHSDLFTGAMYGLPGAAGQSGGKGAGDGEENESVTYQGVTYHPGVNGTSESYGSANAQGGFGGGAAAGANGANGGNGGIAHNSDGTKLADGGRGGTGGNGVNGPTATVPGCGGHGGHGGGGGGGAGGASGATYNWSSSKGVGGTGGNGGDGAPGCVIVYW